MKPIIGIIILFILITGCEKQTQWNLTKKNYPYIVVDGMVTSEYKKQSIKISMPVANLNDIPTPVSGAIITISNGETLATLIENPAASGIYETGSNYAGIPGSTYTLKINYNNQQYTAIANMQQKSNFKILRYSKAANSEKYKIDWVANPYNAEVAAMYEIQLDWSAVAGYQHLPSSESHARLFYYTLPTLDVSEVFSPESDKILFPAGTVIYEKKYVLSPEHAAFIRALLSETNWTGGYFDSAPANVPTNLSEGAVGFFSACPVTMDTIIVTAH